MNMYQDLYHRSNAATQIKHACKTFFWTNFQILLNKSVVSEVTIHPFKQQSAYSAHASIVPCKAVPTCLIFCILYTLLRYFLGNICDRQMQVMHNRGRKIRFFLIYFFINCMPLSLWVPFVKLKTKVNNDLLFSLS